MDGTDEIQSSSSDSETTEPTPKREDMDDILIVSVKESEASALWVEYFHSYFEHICKQANRKPFKVFHLGAEEVLESSGDVRPIAERTSNVKLQLVVMCPTLLEHIARNPLSACGLGKLLLPDRTLALLLGVTDDDLTDIHRTALPTYMQWQRLSVGADQDENFTKEFLGHAVAILSRVWKQQTSVCPQQKPLFSVSPKKIRQGQNTVVILLSHPLQREDIVKISIEKNNEILELKSVKRRNPYTLKITIPDSCTEVSAIVHILVEKNGSVIGSRPIKCESRLRELEQILRATDSPVEFMCQAFGFNPSDKEHLDSCLVYTFQKSQPPNFNLFAQASQASNIFPHRHSHEEYPTLLHLAARYGLEKFAMQLLDCPGGDLACEIRNVCDLTPADIAQSNGHHELAHILSGYMKMNEFKIVYEKLQEITKQSKLIKEEDDSRAYKICPPPRPINPVKSLPSTPTVECVPSVVGYMEMNLKTKSSSEQSVQRPLSPVAHHSKALSQSLAGLMLHKESAYSHPSLHSKNFDALAEDKVQSELAEIITDFKNNIHSISQAEKLVEEWKNRNDVQRSFKEKQAQLNEMRMRYDRMQQEMKNGSKKESPFDRLKKMFHKSKAREDGAKCAVSTIATSAGLAATLTAAQGQRPISSLSLQSTSSSGSSGRMSTISGCSMGDSGTHSDQDDRRNIVGSGHDDEFRHDLNKAIMCLNYTIPPPPRPYHQPNKLAVKSPFPTIEERPSNSPKTSQSPTNSTYYIHFPPSGLPVQVPTSLNLKSKDDLNKRVPERNEEDRDEVDHNYMNVGANGLSPTEELREYINYSHAAANSSRCSS